MEAAEKVSMMPSAPRSVMPVAPARAPNHIPVDVGDDEPVRQRIGMGFASGVHGSGYGSHVAGHGGHELAGANRLEEQRIDLSGFHHLVSRVDTSGNAVEFHHSYGCV